MKVLWVFNVFGIISFTQGFQDQCNIAEEFDFDTNYTNQCQPFSDRQSRLINFKQYGNSVQMELDFVIPFMSIPVNKSLSNLMPSKFGTAVSWINFCLPSNSNKIHLNRTLDRCN